MDMKKIGSFLKALRKEKGLTQEQLAEKLGVAGRTVSRWETASNMPDLSILIQLAVFYDIEVGEILDGERKDKAMDKEVKEKIAGMSKTEAAKIVGAVAAERAMAKGVQTVVFDRGGYLYTGRVKAVADGAREAGLKF